MIIRKKREEQKTGKKMGSKFKKLKSKGSIEFFVDKKRNSDRALKKKAKDSINWQSKTVIYEMLSQYYVQQRSVVFILDSYFDGVWYKNKAY